MRTRFLCLALALTIALSLLPALPAMGLNESVVMDTTTAGMKVVTQPVNVFQGLSVSVSTPTIVETLTANLNITVSGDTQGKELNAYLLVDGTYLYKTPIVGGSGRMTVSAAPAAGTCRLVVLADGMTAGYCDISIAAYLPVTLWNPVLSIAADGDILVTFAEPIAAKDGLFDREVTVDGTVTLCALADPVTLKVSMTAADIPEGTKIVVTGVKYPLLFPSYSFTFTLKMPFREPRYVWAVSNGVYSSDRTIGFSAFDGYQVIEYESAPNASVNGQRAGPATRLLLKNKPVKLEYNAGGEVINIVAAAGELAGNDSSVCYELCLGSEPLSAQMSGLYRGSLHALDTGTLWFGNYPDTAVVASGNLAKMNASLIVTDGTDFEYDRIAADSGFTVDKEAYTYTTYFLWNKSFQTVTDAWIFAEKTP